MISLCIVNESPLTSFNWNNQLKESAEKAAYIEFAVNELRLKIAKSQLDYW